MRGIARAKLGLWEAAASDLHVAAKLDYDEEIGSVLKKVVIINGLMIYIYIYTCHVLIICFEYAG